MSSSKEALLSRLLQPESTVSSSGKSSLIQMVGGDSDEVPSLPQPTNGKEAPVTDEPKAKVPEKKREDEGPSILEMMMAAQREAKLEKEKEKATEEAQASVKPLGGGFKKGFFGGGASKPKPKAATANPTASLSSTVPATSKTAAAAKPALVEVKKNTTASKSNPLVFEEVQKAMEEDTHPLLKQLQSNEWMTPDLVSNFQSNKILSNGFKDPKCMAAMQLLQKSPKEAQARYQNDPEVSVFLQEFAKLMAGHFEALGSSGAGASASTGANTGGSASGASAGGSSGVQEIKSSRVEEISMDVNKSTIPGGSIQEIGPLHAQVLQKKAQGNSTAPVAAPAPAQKAETAVAKSTAPSSSSSSSVKSGAKAAQSAVSEEERVQQILQDEELRTMLMDPDLQRILMECGDPQKFQQHMRNPDTYRKIVRLQQAGLVGTAR